MLQRGAAAHTHDHRVIGGIFQIERHRLLDLQPGQRQPTAVGKV